MPGRRGYKYPTVPKSPNPSFQIFANGLAGQTQLSRSIIKLLEHALKPTNHRPWILKVGQLSNATQNHQHNPETSTNDMSLENFCYAVISTLSTTA